MTLDELNGLSDEELNRRLAPLADSEFWTEQQLALADKLADAMKRFRSLQKRESFSGWAIESEIEKLEGEDAQLVPRFTSDLNAVATVEAGLSGFTSDLYANHLVNLLKPHRIDTYNPERDGAPMLAWSGVFTTVTATARQRAEAIYLTLALNLNQP